MRLKCFKGRVLTALPLLIQHTSAQWLGFFGDVNPSSNLAVGADFWQLEHILMNDYLFYTVPPNLINAIYIVSMEAQPLGYENMMKYGTYTEAALGDYVDTSMYSRWLMANFLSLNPVPPGHPDPRFTVFDQAIRRLDDFMDWMYRNQPEVRYAQPWFF